MTDLRTSVISHTHSVIEHSDWPLDFCNHHTQMMWMHMQVHARIRLRSTEASAPQVLSLPDQVLQLVVSVCPGNLMIYRVKQLLIHAVHSSSLYIMYPGMFQPLVGFVVSWTGHCYITRTCTHTHTHTHTRILSHFDGTEGNRTCWHSSGPQTSEAPLNTSKCHKNWRNRNRGTHVMTVIGPHLF